MISSQVSAGLLAACPYCEAARGAIFRGPIDYILTAAAALVLAFAVRHAVKCLINPGERASGHIKATVLDDAVIQERGKT